MRSTTLSAAIHPSPKRKRDPPPPPIPHINTTLRTETTPPRDSPEPDSPRNAVADQLQSMSLKNIPSIHMGPLSPTDDIMRKKPKLQDKSRVDSGTSLDEHLAGVNIGLQQDGQKDSKNSVAVNTLPVRRKEIPETPEAKQPRTLLNTVPAFAQLPTSSFPTSLSQPPIVGSDDAKTKENTQPRRRTKSVSPPPSPLTWQDSEITGHLADPSKDPDDDGTGLNGIGFRPTPATAYARAQRRRQQVLDWKAREAREARAKRSERRRRGVGGASSREATVERETRTVDTAITSDTSRRTVKFAV
ncbi:unnamed protein product [Periconia digitata]|uniref:Uncharacterized protein n=1 Tax=Periconia digitata TaxID=1303443 RepID=A0A9W4UNF6_9PLEO|nr:unnamed protein product [Periconia digitata]